MSALLFLCNIALADEAVTAGYTPNINVNYSAPNFDPHSKFQNFSRSDDRRKLGLPFAGLHYGYSSNQLKYVDYFEQETAIVKSVHSPSIVVGGYLGRDRKHTVALSVPASLIASSESQKLEANEVGVGHLQVEGKFSPLSSGKRGLLGPWGMSTGARAWIPLGEMSSPVMYPGVAGMVFVDVDKPLFQKKKKKRPGQKSVEPKEGLKHHIAFGSNFLYQPTAELENLSWGSMMTIKVGYALDVLPKESQDSLVTLSSEILWNAMVTDISNPQAMGGEIVFSARPYIPEISGVEFLSTLSPRVSYAMGVGTLPGTPSSRVNISLMYAK